MKNLLLILATIGTLTTNAQTSAYHPLGLNGKWKLMQYKDFSTGQIMNEPEKLSSSMIFEFKDDGVSGHFDGHTVTNETTGEYTLEKENIIHVSKVGGTKVGEPEWGSRFWNTIYQSSSYIINQDTLTIMYDKNTKAMVFTKADTEDK